MKKYFFLLFTLCYMLASGVTFFADAAESASIKQLRFDALKGDADAQFSLGRHYEEGEGGLHQDYQQAKTWYEKAAKQGFTIAQFSLGDMYYYGKGIRQDYQQAKKWYEEAAMNGSAYAQFALGRLYYFGEGVRQDYHEAKFWLEKAATQGNARAQWALGTLYEDGKGARQNLSEAKEWYGKACDNGLQDGCDAYARLNRGR